MNKKTLSAAILTSAALIIAIPVVSHAAGYKGDCDRGGKMFQGKGKYKGERMGGAMSERMLGRMSDKLDLTEEQQEQIKGIMETSQETREAARETMQENRQALRDLDPAAADYDAKVAEYAEVLASMKKEAILERADIRKQIDAVLTEEQQEKLAEFQDSRGKRFGRF